MSDDTTSGRIDSVRRPKRVTSTCPECKQRRHGPDAALEDWEAARVPLERRIAALEAENARLTERLQAADDDRHSAFMALPVTPDSQIAWAGLIYPHAVRVADEFAIRTAQIQAHERTTTRLEAENAELVAALKGLLVHVDYGLSMAELKAGVLSRMDAIRDAEAAIAKAEGREAIRSAFEARVDGPSCFNSEVGCEDGDAACGFVRAGYGWQCLENDACGRFIAPGEKGHAFIEQHHAKAEGREVEP